MQPFLLYIILLVGYNNCEANFNTANYSNLNKTKTALGNTLNHFNKFIAIINDDWIASEKDESNLFSTPIIKTQNKTSFIEQKDKNSQFFISLYLSNFLLVSTLDLPPPLI